MNKLKKFILINFVLLLASYGTMQSAFENQKKNNTDEFLVEKKSPLVMPPDYNELPIPKTNQNRDLIEENKIQELVVNNEGESKELNNTEDVDINFEESLLKKIKKN